MNEQLTRIVALVARSSFPVEEYTWFTAGKDVAEAAARIINPHSHYDHPALNLPLPKCGFALTADEGDGTRIETAMFEQEGDSIGVHLMVQDNAKGTYTPVSLIVPRTADSPEDVEYEITTHLPMTRQELAEFASEAISMLSVFLSVCAGRPYISGEVPTITATGRRQLAKGKKPLIKWSTVTIDLSAVRQKQEHQGGTHASPRMHERRGHWATRKASGKRYWVRPCVVGKAKDGIGFHDYKVTAGL